MKDAVKSALVLFAITLVAGALLGAVYHVTKEPIRIQKERISGIMRDLTKRQRMPS